MATPSASRSNATGQRTIPLRSTDAQTVVPVSQAWRCPFFILSRWRIYLAERGTRAIAAKDYGTGRWSTRLPHRADSVWVFPPRKAPRLRRTLRHCPLWAPNPEVPDDLAARQYASHACLPILTQAREAEGKTAAGLEWGRERLAWRSNTLRVIEE